MEKIIQLIGNEYNWYVYFKYYYVFYFLTTANTLFLLGKTEITYASSVAIALEPVLDSAASAAFAIGVFGTGCLAIPVLAAVNALQYVV